MRFLPRHRGWAAVLLGAALLAASAPQPSHAQSAARRVPPNAVAIVTHPGVGVDNLTLAQLRQVFLAQRRRWPNGERVTLLVRAPTASEREMVLNRIYHMTEPQYRQFWMGKVFRDEVPRDPRLVYDSGAARELVTRIRGAITFVPANQRGGGRVLRIDGKLPGEPGYPLQ